MKLSSKILALDLDRTLTEGGEDRVSPNLRDLLKRLRKEGWTLVLVTGRDRSYVQSREDLEGLFEAWVLENGVEVYLPNEGTSRVYIPAEWDEFRRRASRLPSVSAKTWTFSLLKEDVEKVKTVAQGLGTPIVFKDNRGLLNVLPEGVHKGTGLRRAMELLRVDGWRAAVGDALSDLDLLWVADFKVAVGDAEEAVKTISDYIAKNPNGAGVEEFLCELLSSKYGGVSP